jgi:hypothetical protein
MLEAGLEALEDPWRLRFRRARRERPREALRSDSSGKRRNASSEQVLFMLREPPVIVRITVTILYYKFRGAARAM